MHTRKTVRKVKWDNMAGASINCNIPTIIKKMSKIIMRNNREVFRKLMNMFFDFLTNKKVHVPTTILTYNGFW